VVMFIVLLLSSDSKFETADIGHISPAHEWR
jgi:hypothetical protein